jgi:hypothetical protein
MTIDGTFLGHPIEYWIELNKRPKELKVEELLREIVVLKGQLQFTKEKLDYINKVLNRQENL